MKSKTVRRRGRGRGLTLSLAPALTPLRNRNLHLPLNLAGSPTPKRAFTLVEVMIVVALMALLSGLAVMSFAGPLRKARAREVVERVRVLDETTRKYCRRVGRPANVVLDLSEGTLWRDEGRGAAAAQWTAMPSGGRVAEVRVGGDRIENGKAEVQVSSLGLSRSYAVRVVGPEVDRWVVVAGLSGQVTVVNDESEVGRILEGATGSGREPR